MNEGMMERGEALATVRRGGEGNVDVWMFTKREGATAAKTTNQE